MQIKVILLFSHPRRVLPEAIAPKHQMRKGVNEGLFTVMKNSRRCVISPENYLCLCHRLVDGNASNISLGAMWELSQLWDQCLGSTHGGGGSGTPLPLGSFCAWHTQHPPRRKPSCFYTWSDPRETWLWKRSPERRVNDSQRRQDFPEHSFYSVLMKPGLLAISSSKMSDTVRCFGTAFTKRESWRRGKGTEYDVFFCGFFSKQWQVIPTVANISRGRFR